MPGFVTFVKCNAKALLTLRIKSAFAPYGVESRLATAVGLCLAVCEPLPVTAVSMVTMFLTPHPPPKTSTQPSPSSRFRNLKPELDVPPGVTAAAFIMNVMLVEQPPPCLHVVPAFANTARPAVLLCEASHRPQAEKNRDILSACP
jgi:hypothetical protein